MLRLPPVRLDFGLALCRWVLLACVGALALAGCASRKQVMLVQEDVARIRVNVDSLKQQQQAAQATLSEIQTQIRDVQAETQYGSTALEEKVEGIAARLDEILDRMDRTLAPLEEFIRRQSATDTAHGGAMGVDYYDGALRDLSTGNYDLAEVGFLQFLEKYPNSDLADDARFGLAETYYARKRYDEAIEDYDRVVTMNPKGSKAAEALLKIGLCHKDKGDSRQAQKTWEELIKQFPQTEEAKIAKIRLNELKGGN